MRLLLTSVLLIFCLGQAQAGQTGAQLTLDGPRNGLASPPGSAGPGLVSAPIGADILPVERAYQLEVEILEDNNIRVYWHIEDAYYLYQHRFGFELTDSAGAIPLEVELPPALERNDEFFGDVSVYYNSADINLRSARTSGTARLTIASQGCADAGLCYPPQKQHYQLDFDTASAVAIPASTRGARTAADATVSATAGQLITMVALAFLGGAILNLMPCVFPILSLKVLSFARSSDHDRHLHGWVYAAGVIVSFVLVAAILITLQQAGQAIGWGFQLQSSGFVITLAYLFIAMGLSLSGVFHLGGSVMGAGSGLADRAGLTGSFFTGVLAVVVASPCTAPFMGTALGFALTQPPQTGLLIFAALGAGMAAPLLLLSYSKAARNLMPRPGPWMDTLKQLLAFPLYATAIWLFWVAGRQTGVNTMAAAMLGALVLALGLWLWGQATWRRILAIGCVLLAAGLGTLHNLDDNTGNEQLPAGKLAWSEQRLTQLRSEGQPVFLDVTADWCITCIANERTVLLTAEMTEAFAEHGVAYMIADWTNYDADIARMLERYGRSGIPLYLMYPADTALQPLILPQILTSDTVLAALREVSRKKPAVASSF